MIGNQISKVDEGVMTVAATSAQARYVLPEVIKTFKQDYPKIKLELKLGSSEQILEMVKNNEVDFALVSILPKSLNIEKINLLKNSWNVFRKNNFFS